MAWIHLLGKCRHLSLVRRHFLCLWGFWKRQRMRVFHIEGNECERFKRVNGGS